MQLTISYLGRPQLAPLGTRQDMLKEDYGFDCTCTRCVAEAGVADKVGTMAREMRTHTPTHTYTHTSVRVTCVICHPAQ